METPQLVISPINNFIEVCVKIYIATGKRNNIIVKITYLSHEHFTVYLSVLQKKEHTNYSYWNIRDIG